MIKFAGVVALAVAAVAAQSAAAVTVIGATKVVVTSATPTYIQVSELQAFQFGTGTDVALASNGATASALSTYSSQSTPGEAIDGVVSTDYPNIYHSQGSGSNEFLQIDFAAPATLSSLTIYGRNGCCTERDLFNVEIFNAHNDVLFNGTVDARGAPGTVTFDAPVGGVPEAATWMMMVAGFGLVGAGLRRRSAVAA